MTTKTEMKLSEFLKGSNNEAIAVCGTKIFTYRKKKNGNWTVETDETGAGGFVREGLHEWFTGKQFAKAVDVPEISEEFRKLYKKDCSAVCFNKIGSKVTEVKIVWDIGEL